MLSTLKTVKLPVHVVLPSYRLSSAADGFTAMPRDMAPQTKSATATLVKAML
jgi:hypothetical protein